MDLEKEEALATLCEGRSELVGLALWLLKERSKVGNELHNADEG